MVSQVEWAPKLEREIFRVVGRDGIRVTFGVLEDGRCAVVRGGVGGGGVIDVFVANARGIPTPAKPRTDVVGARDITRLIPQPR